MERRWPTGTRLGALARRCWCRWRVTGHAGPPWTFWRMCGNVPYDYPLGCYPWFWMACGRAWIHTHIENRWRDATVHRADPHTP